METKICNKCGSPKPLSEYHVASRNVDGRYHTCKTCRKEIDAIYYHASDKREKNKQRAVDNQTRIVEYKRQKGCKFCPEGEPVALDFHHKDDNKEFNLSQAGKRFGWQRVIQEMEKCDVVCSNCHRKIHAGIIGL